MAAEAAELGSARWISSRARASMSTTSRGAVRRRYSRLSWSAALTLDLLRDVRPRAALPRRGRRGGVGLGSACVRLGGPGCDRGCARGRLHSRGRSSSSRSRRGRCVRAGRSPFTSRGRRSGGARRRRIFPPTRCSDGPTTDGSAISSTSLQVQAGRLALVYGLGERARRARSPSGTRTCRSDSRSTLGRGPRQPRPGPG